MDRTALKAQLLIDEGRILRVYRDPVGLLTVGVGHLVRPGDQLRYDQTISLDRCEALLDDDVTVALMTCHKIWPAFDAYPEAAQQVVANMAFNLGERRLRSFQRMIRAIAACRWQAAADEIRHSRYASQVGQRAERLAQRLENIAHGNEEASPQET